MKTIALILMACLFMVVGCTEHPETGEIRPDYMPEGYELICNANGDYKWESQTHQSGMTGTKEQIMDNAWEEYNEGAFEECDPETITYEGEEYPATVPFKQGMTLYPGQSAILEMELDLSDK